MNTHAAQIVKWIEENTSTQEDVDSILNHIASLYLTNHSPNDAQIRESTLGIEPILNTLSGKRQRKLQRVMRDLCQESQQKAFCDGISLGAKLAAELLFR